MKVKVRCPDCDAVIDVELRNWWCGYEWRRVYTCYHCGHLGGMRDITKEPYRLPKWDRGRRTT